MNNPVRLDSHTHKNLRVKKTAEMVAGARLGNSTVVLREFASLALDYPILFTKNKDMGNFVCVALFGFDEGENLFIRDNRWDAAYMPLNIVRQPFMIGAGQQHSQGQGDDSVVFIDINDARVQEQDGEALFNERGFPTPYMEKMTSILRALKDGYAETQVFIAKLLALQLVVPATLKIELVNQETRQIEGLYAIDKEKFQSLSGEEIVELHQLGYLEPIYMMLASFGHIPSLIERKNKKLTG